MTPKDKIKFKDTAQIREAVDFFPTEQTNGEEKERLLESTHYVEGYAALYNRYPLFEIDGETVYEEFRRGCFDNAEMTDIIMQYDHAGMVYARTRNGSLVVKVDDAGLRIGADLSLTEAARQMYEAIDKGLVVKMSWRFLPGEWFFDEGTNTIVHTSVRKVYDVSAVSFPANDNTNINARAWVDGVIGLAARREAELEARRKKLAIKIKIQEATNHEPH